MARRGSKKPRIPPHAALDPDGLGAWMLRFLEDLRVRNFSARTVENRENALGMFLAWCLERGLTRPAEITRPILQRYQRHLFYHRKADGAPLSFFTQSNRLGAVRSWFQWLTRQNLLLYNPASELDLPHLTRRLPAHVLTPAEAEAVLALPELDDPLGLRDRAILETLYSTGMRRMEIAGLRVFDLDTGHGTVTIRQGKGRKDRVVPIGARALAWIRKYLDEVRPGLVVEPDEGTLFLAHTGERLRLDRLTALVADYVARAELGKRGSCHLWRHTMATAMLENGADIRFIQEMLGHSNLATTQIYTRVSIQRLKEIHSATHPAAGLGPPKKAPGEDPAESPADPSVPAADGTEPSGT